MRSESLVNLFKKLNWAFANNNAFRLKRKIIREYAISQHGGFYGYARDIVADLDRLFHTLDGKAAPSHLAGAANIVNKASYACEKGCESEYFKFELYRNGNLHIVFKRADLVAKANRIVADYYGAGMEEVHLRNELCWGGTLQNLTLPRRSRKGQSLPN